jgi:osmotically-inducible protein OsmY
MAISKEEPPMNLLSKLFGSANKYNDAQLVSQATTAITVDPMINDPGSLVVTSKNGVMTLSGIVQRAQEKERIEGVVRSSLTTVGLKHERIINELKLPHSSG